MGGNLSSVVSKCRAKRMQGTLQTRNINDLDEKKEEQFKDNFFKYSNQNEININSKASQEKLKKDPLKVPIHKTPDTKASEKHKEPILVSSSNLEFNRHNKFMNENPVENIIKQKSFVEERSEIKNKSAFDYNINKGNNGNSFTGPQNNNLNDINNLQFFLSLNNMSDSAHESNRNILCPNLHGDLLWSGEKKECQECENFNYGFYCTIDFYFICFKCYDYTIQKDCPHNHQLKWVGNKKCFNCCEFNFCMHCEKDNYSVCYKCYDYDFRQTFCPNKHEFKYYNFKSCFLCKKKNKCLGCEKDDFYLCLCNLNKNEIEVPVEMDTCSVFRTVPKFQFRTNKCILGHDLIWKKMDNTCYKCENTFDTGLFCEICEFYSHCIECYDFKFPVLDCPNSHGNQYYKWISEKKECLRCKKIHTGYYCSKCEYFVCRKNCVNSIIKKFTGKDRPHINSQNIKNQLVLERLDLNNAIFPDEDKASMIDCSLRDIRIDDLNQSMNSFKVVSSRKPEIQLRQDSYNKFKGNTSISKDQEFNQVFDDSNHRLSYGSNLGQNPQIMNFLNEDKNVNKIYTTGADLLNIMKGPSIASSMNKIYESQNKNEFIVNSQNTLPNDSGTPLSSTKNHISDGQGKYINIDNYYESYNSNQNDTNDLSFRPNIGSSDNKLNRINDSVNLEGKKYYTNSEYGTNLNNNFDTAQKYNFIVSSGNPKVQTNYYSGYNSFQYTTSNFFNKDFIKRIRVLDEKYVASSTQENMIAIWNYLNGMFFKNIKFESEAYKDILFDSMLIINEFYLLILYSSGNISIHDIRIEDTAEYINLNMGQSSSLLRISDNQFVFGLDSKMAIWFFKSPNIEKYIQFSKMTGKVFFLEKANMKSNSLRIVSCDEKSIKLWNQIDFTFIKEIEYPQSNLFNNLSFEQKNLLSFERILSILKISDDKLIVYNQTLNSISLLDLETTDCINDSKTFERKVIDLGNNSKRIFSSDMFGNLVSFVDGIATLWELDNNQTNSKALKHNDSNTSYYSSYESLYGKVFLKKIEEINLGKKEISDLKLLHSISFVTIDNLSKVTFWDFHK